ncbi:MAG: bifunctional UDP-N-acetylmuramoyl-tripeptide:D-alanyl-D-alanine ligase/alanine racemase [Bacteroidota bacterium]
MNLFAVNVITGKRKHMTTKFDYDLSNIAEIVRGELKANKNQIIRHLHVDSRTAFISGDALFFAIRGERHDGHRFIPSLAEKGYRNFVISENYLPEKMPECNFILVKDTLQALQLLARHKRDRLKGKVIGITGSNGKTIVKEWLFQLLQSHKKTERSPKSYNSQVGVPLSLWSIDEDADFALIEAGISHPGEMIIQQQMIRPDIGIITNIREAHQENFKSYEHKAREKLMLFKNCDIIVHGIDQEPINRMIKEAPYMKDKLHFTWSFRDHSADLKILSVKKENNNTRISALYGYRKIQWTIPFTDYGSVENSVICFSCILQLGFLPATMAERMRNLTPIEMRLEQKTGINGCTLINDSYNSDLVSLSIAIDYLNQQQNPVKTIVLSDILQSGKEEKELYMEVAILLNKKNIDRLIGIGPSISKNKQLFNEGSVFYDSTDDFLKGNNYNSFYNEAILIKGSRPFHFEKITAFLEEKVHQTVLEINMNSLVHNLNDYRSKLNPGVKIMVMVKALAYGSGSSEIARLLQYHKVNYLAVAYADEGYELRKAGIEIPIMVMNPEVSTFRGLTEHNLEPEIYSFNILKRFAGYLEQSGIKNYPVHIKIDTGMKRLGFNIADIELLTKELHLASCIKIKTVFSHLAAADEPEHDEFTYQQVSRFKEAAEIIQKSIDYPIDRHILNSAGIERFPDAQFEMVRLGIGLYGVSVKNKKNLKNISTLKSIVSQIREVHKGESVGYSRNGILKNNGKIAIIPIGYADGLKRNLGNNVGKIYINGKFAPIVGNICMDMCMIDISGIDAKEGDEVIIFGDKLPVSKIAEWAGTIPYEILTSVSSRVKRIYTQE